ncbi:hypothetical protein B987_02399 [Brucella suis F7/06-5]|nr:hypothetical protein B987_02399 [Brucella suis F7/06-5]
MSLLRSDPLGDLPDDGQFALRREPDDIFGRDGCVIYDNPGGFGAGFRRLPCDIVQ